MKNKWNRLREMFKKEEPKLETWHKESIQQHAAFIAEGGILTFRNRRNKT